MFQSILNRAKFYEHAVDSLLRVASSYPAVGTVKEGNCLCKMLDR